MFLRLYFSLGGKMSFADFLDSMHSHHQKEKIPDEILEAFKSADPTGKGTIPAKELKHILGRWGEKLSPREGNSLSYLLYLVWLSKLSQ